MPARASGNSFFDVHDPAETLEKYRAAISATMRVFQQLIDGCTMARDRAALESIRKMTNEMIDSALARLDDEGPN